MNDYQNFIRLSRYARWTGDRRETWAETVSRYFAFFEEQLGLRAEDNQELYAAVRSMDVLPSMRALWSAGPALARDHASGYNCAFDTIDSVRVWDEMLYLLACTAGVGFSVERQVVTQLPVVPDALHPTDTVITVRDSKIGWATALRELVAMLFAGSIPTWDLSRIRPRGARLKTMGGRASGPGPLDELLRFVVHVFKGATGRRLNSLECHDICCKIADCVVLGGVRRSALLSLSNLSDPRMRDAKAGDWWQQADYRRNANNSVAYTEKPDVGAWLAEWRALYMSKSGERGVYDRAGTVAKIQANGRVVTWPNGEPILFGVNPCGEIDLRPKQTCNLSNIIARPHDTVEVLEAKARSAAVLGTWQATLTNFRYLRAAWQKNCEEERLLGVGIAGILDCPLLSTRTQETRELLEHLRETVRETNAEWAERLGINKAASITCVKPDGNSSQLVNSSSGIHPRYARYYVRRVEADNADPLTTFMKAAGFQHEPLLGKEGTTTSFMFPHTAPETSRLRDDVSALDQLEHSKMFQKHWATHKVSTTCYVREHEWPRVGAWVYDNWSEIGGMSFLPYDTGSHRQAPYEEITEAAYTDLLAAQPKDVDWAGLSVYEADDNTTGAQTLACVAGHCEI